ncbi:ribose-5-phosphate isomerase RpiA [Halobaculum sp. CBA1158]|uniref:ribose-5-phosphate isomerase RpiA n=1 Tax=Halobaculum sp. CBA1158 TaxID=2904243 RepID=UPI001F199731|nr:ribose-5-phosphate isomerase RpiA [Halobaculum sp. CBA1158]UIP00130.1 ribose-5-phosphate isomerase RpiA [Halobaculum sp. CBA1158]
MKNTEGTEAAKRAAGEAAAAEVADGDRVGLGTGSTAAHAIRDLGERVAEGLDIEGVATSYQSRALAREAGIPLASLSDVARVDVAIDGADQAAPESNALVKGGGAAHAREKVVASAADEFLVVADDSKLADPLDHPVPVEVLSDAVARVERALRDAGGDPTLREAERKDGPVITDNGNLVLDCEFGAIDAPASLARTLSGTPGVVEHGLFVGLADELYVGEADGAVAVRSLK